MEEATLTSKCQITVPKVVRDNLGLAPGDKIQFVPAWEGYRLVVIKGAGIESLCGMFKGRRNAPLSITQMNKVIAEMGSRGEADAPLRTKRKPR